MEEEGLHHLCCLLSVQSECWCNSLHTHDTHTTGIKCNGDAHNVNSNWPHKSSNTHMQYIPTNCWLCVVSVCRGPKYHLLAHTTLTIAHVQDSFRTHDLSISATGEWRLLSFGCLLSLNSKSNKLINHHCSRGQCILAASLWQCVLPSGRPASLYDPAGYQRQDQGEFTLCHRP